MRRWQRHFQIYRFQDQTATNQDRNWGRFPLSVDAACPPQRLSENQIVWFSPSVQQETHYLSTDGAAGKALQDDQESKGTKEDHLSGVQSSHGGHLAKNTEATRAEAMFYINREKGIVM